MWSKNTAPLFGFGRVEMLKLGQLIFQISLLVDQIKTQMKISNLNKSSYFIILTLNTLFKSLKTFLTVQGAQPTWD